MRLHTGVRLRVQLKHINDTCQQVRLVSVKAERPNYPSRSHARQGGGALHDNTDMTP